jgi:hypothetical protein
MQCLRPIESYYAADPRFVDFGGQKSCRREASILASMSSISSS